MKKILFVLGLIGTLSLGTVSASYTYNIPGKHKKEVKHSNGKVTKKEMKDNGAYSQKTYDTHGNMKKKKVDANGNVTKKKKSES